MPRQAHDTMIYTRADGVTATQTLYLRQVETALALAEQYGLEDDPWISRLYECRALVRETLGLPDLAAERRQGESLPGEALGMLRLVQSPN